MRSFASLIPARCPQIERLCPVPIPSHSKCLPPGELPRIIRLGKLERRAAAALLQCAFKDKARPADIPTFQQTGSPREQRSLVSYAGIWVTARSGGALL